MTVDAGVLALGSGFMVTTGGALWKAASLRSELFGSYHNRVALGQAALDERAATALRSLAERVNEVLGELERFDPHQVIADPSELQGHVETVNRVLTARPKLPRYFKGMLRVGPAFLGLLGLSLLGEAVALAYFSGWNRARRLGYAGLWTAVGSFALVAVVAVYFFTLLHRFSGAEILSADNQ
jgi:hypothetical protein